MLIPVRYVGPTPAAQHAIDGHLPLGPDDPAALFTVDGVERSVPVRCLSPFVDLEPRTAVGPALADLLRATAQSVTLAPSDLDLSARFAAPGFRSVSDADRCLLSVVFGLGARESWAARQHWSKTLGIDLPEVGLIAAELDAHGCHSHRAIAPRQAYTRSLYGRLPLARRLACAAVLAEVREAWLHHLAAHPDALASQRVIDDTHLLDIRLPEATTTSTDLENLADDLNEAVLDAAARGVQLVRSLAQDPAHHDALDAHQLRDWLGETPLPPRSLPARRVVTDGALLDVLTGEALPWTEHRVLVGLREPEVRQRFADLAADLAFFDDDDDDEPIDLRGIVLPSLPRGLDAQASDAQLPMPAAETAVAWFSDGTPVHVFRDGDTWVVLVPSLLPLTVADGATVQAQPELHVVRTTQPRVQLTLGTQVLELQLAPETP